jgi:hypothetical protein
MTCWIYSLAEGCEIVEKKAKMKNIPVAVNIKNTNPLKEVQYTEVILTISWFFLSFFL